ncbi:hypothetical protein GTP45_20105 [Pseudoduganella sp. FT55W]|uniref:Sel1 repeat family protein n=1 Tax=Duganella rivi TaxID=2666083 RepID=A0A7X4KCF7_9BURK|nr:SEL1-like repeat protein [Duganella rivi]MYM69126.1 hypothetical protein [Duganella rivi]
MAKREGLHLIRGARAGSADAQLALARCYLDGAAGLPANLPTALYWLERAAQQDCAEASLLMVDARRKLAEHQAQAVQAAPMTADSLEQAWQDGEYLTYLAHTLPRARALWKTHGIPQRRTAAEGPLLLPVADARLMTRCGLGLQSAGAAAGADAAAEMYRYFQLAARSGDAEAQLALGLLLARMGPDGRRLLDSPHRVNSKLAVRWMTQAGNQGMSQAWFMLARLHSRCDLAQRSPADVDACLEKAAALGHVEAQLECGARAWRARGAAPDNDVRAAYWLLLAAKQGCASAAALLRKVSPARGARQWTQPPPPPQDGTHRLADCEVMLSARLELAAQFNLSRVETLMIDPSEADHGHCLVLRIYGAYGRSKRRLVLVQTDAQREVLDRVSRLFRNIDCGPDGPEGSYRKRLYRLNARCRATV